MAYTRDFGNGDTDVLVQRYEADGDVIGGVIVVDNAAGLATDHASIAGLASGGFVVAWEQSAAAGGSHSAWFRLYDASGVAIAGAQMIDEIGSINQDVQVAALQDGGFVVAYVDNGWASGNGTEITAVVYDADGVPRSGTILVNADTDLNQLRPTVTVLSNGCFVIGWVSAGQLFYQAYDPSGAALGSNYLADSSDVVEAEIAALADGRMANVRESSLTDGDGSSVRSSIHELIRITDGTGMDETLAGDGLRDVITGNEGNDILDGFGADDVLAGGEGVDTLRGGAGADQLDGGAGTDTASYYTSAAAVSVDLGAGTAGGGDAQGDTLSDIENLSGSNIGDDVLAGDAGANKLQGWGGGDVLRGGAGADTLDGGAGTDTASWYTSAAGVTVDLAAGTASGGDAAGDVLSGIESLSGSNLGGDILTGNGGANTLQGWGGDDVLRGGAGADVLEGGAGTDTASYYSGAVGVTVNLAAGLGKFGDAAGDTLTGIENLNGSNLGVDILTGSAGANVLQGWGGSDTLIGAAGKDTLTAGSGADTIVFHALGDSVVGANADVVTDFSHAQGDEIDLETIDANTIAVGDQAFSFISANLYSGTAGQLRFSIVNGVTTVAGDVNGDQVSDFHIVLTGSIALVAADFAL